MNRVGFKRKSRGERMLESFEEGGRGAQPRHSKPLRSLPTLGCSSPPTPDKHPKKMRVTHVPGRDEKENEVHTGLENDVAPTVVVDRPVGMLNGGNYCYMAATLQALLTPSFVQKLTKVGEDVQFMQKLPEAGVVRTLLAVAKRIDAERGQAGGDWTTGITDVHALVQRRFSALRGNRQQDAAEFYHLLLDGLMEEIVTAESSSYEDGAVPLSKTGCPASQTFLMSFLCKREGTCGNVFEVKRSQWFMEFAVSEGSKDVAAELSRQFQEDQEESYFCPACDSFHNFKERILGLNQVPQFFVVHANRNQDTQKCQAPLIVPQKLVVENGVVVAKSLVATQESQTAAQAEESSTPVKPQPLKEETSEGGASEPQTTPRRRSPCSARRIEENFGSGGRSVGTSRGALVGGDAEEFSTPKRVQGKEEFSTPVAPTRRSTFESPKKDDGASFAMPHSLLEEHEQFQLAVQESLKASGGNANVAIEDENDEFLQRALRESLEESQQLESSSQDAENKGINGKEDKITNEIEPTPFEAKGKLFDDSIPEEPVGSMFNLVGFVTHHGGTVSSGHYTARVKTSSGAWWWCNDENVMEEEADVAMENAGKGSLFFYERENPVDSHH
ncbi:hypothetical protein BSKO_02053 [Bryopsis sp. KO-2023]|nr:hypothetical protein BSKO_02053 [Bryopsis sp. KO-2023]